MTTLAKRIILLCVLFCGVYLQYRAEQTVEKARVSKRTNERTRIQREQFMMRAVKLSLVKNPEEELRGGSVIVKTGKVVGEGWNDSRLMNDPEAHAEVSSIIKACSNLDTNDLRGAELYTAVQPCPRCLSMIGTIGIENVYYCIPRWKIGKFDNGHSREYLVEQMARSQMEKKVREIQVQPRNADTFAGKF